MSWRAGFVGCWAAQVNGTKDAKDSTPTNNVASSSAEWLGKVTVPGGFWKENKAGAQSATMLDGQNAGDAFGTVLQEAIEGAKQDARALAKSACCKTVKLSIVYYDNNGFGWYDGGRMSRFYKIMRHEEAFFMFGKEGPLRNVLVK